MGDSSPVSITPIEVLPVYLSLVGIITLKCKSVPSSEADLTAACTALSSAIAKYRAMLAPLSSILPAAKDLAELEGKGFDISKYPIMDPEEYRGILRTLQREAKLYSSPLSGDEIHAAYFSKENIEKRDSLIASGKMKVSWGNIIESMIGALGQTRLIRQEMQNNDQGIKMLLIASLLPQILVLSCIIMQYMLLKKREMGAKRRNQQITRDRQLLAQLVERRREGGQPIELV